MWRLLIHGELDGALNMGIDRAIQLCRERGMSPPTLRLYRWARPTVSLGRFQSTETVDLGFCADEGIDVMRRHTGGRGVLHADEVTYSLVAAQSDGIARGVAASYIQVSTALERAYRTLGVAAEVVSRDGRVHSSGACYMQSTRADLVVDGAKLSGSAQVWAGSTMLQHGSIVLDRDVAREARCFGLDSEQSEQLSSTTRTLADALGDTPAVSEIETALACGFESAFGVRLVFGSLSMVEAELAAQLRHESAVHTAASDLRL